MGTAGDYLLIRNAIKSAKKKTKVSGLISWEGPKGEK